MPGAFSPLTDRLCTPSTSTPHIQVVAASGPRLAVWSLSGVSARTWLVHSSLVLPDDKRITAIDCSSGVLSSPFLLASNHSPCAGLLVVATQSTLSVHTLVMENDLPTWSSKWSCRSQELSCIRFCPSLAYLATVSEVSTHVTALRFRFDPWLASQNSSHNSYDVRPANSSNSSP